VSEKRLLFSGNVFILRPRINLCPLESFFTTADTYFNNDKTYNFPRGDRLWVADIIKIMTFLEKTLSQHANYCYLTIKLHIIRLGNNIGSEVPTIFLEFPVACDTV